MARDEHLTRDAGFTLSEAITILSIVGVLCFVVIAAYRFSGETTRRIACVSNQRVLENAVPAYQAEHQGRSPASLAELAPYVPKRAGIDVCTSDPDLKLDWDPSTGDVSCRIHPAP